MPFVSGERDVRVLFEKLGGVRVDVRGLRVFGVALPDLHRGVDVPLLGSMRVAIRGRISDTVLHKIRALRLQRDGVEQHRFELRHKQMRVLVGSGEFDMDMVSHLFPYEHELLCVRLFEKLPKLGRVWNVASLQK